MCAIVDSSTERANTGHWACTVLAGHWAYTVLEIITSEIIKRNPKLFCADYDNKNMNMAPSRHLSFVYNYIEWN